MSFPRLSGISSEPPEYELQQAKPQTLYIYASVNKSIQRKIYDEKAFCLVHNNNNSYNNNYNNYNNYNNSYNNNNNNNNNHNKNDKSDADVHNNKTIIIIIIIIIIMTLVMKQQLFLQRMTFNVFTVHFVINNNDKYYYYYYYYYYYHYSNGSNYKIKHQHKLEEKFKTPYRY